MRSPAFGLGLATLVAYLLAGQPVRADALQDLAAAAAKKGPVIWYESSAPEQILKVSTAFNKRYPDIRVQYVRNTGGGGIAARVIQEAEAGAATASFFIGDTAQAVPLNQRGLLLSRDWKTLGVDPALVTTPYAVAATASLGVLIWNKQRVAEADLPKTWDDFLAERWRGKVGQWVRAPTLGTLAKVYGEQHMRDYVRRLIDLKAMIYPSTYQLAQQVAAGEVDIGMGLYHSAQPVIAAGAPLGMRFLDPTPVNTLYSAVVGKGGNPEGAQVLLAWLATLEGAKAYEAAIGRGNPLVKGTDTAERVGNRQLVEFGFADAGAIEKLDAELTQMLMAVEKKR
ncbi:MAG: extracellular solute-binding protein [Hyphomicrobiales bacterium]|nr:extracellular solute-binding protein [Hyphomicrobiales bacterium]